jgi:hypothetical protein
MEDYRKTKDKLLTKAFDKKEFNEGPNPDFMLGPQDRRPPFNINLDYDPRTERKEVGVDYTKKVGEGKTFSIGGSYQPEFQTERPGFFPGQTIEVENPSNYNVRAGYKGKNFGVNVNVGTQGYGAGMNFNRQF